MDPEHWSIKQLKAELTTRGVRIDDCTEKAELVARIRTSVRRAGNADPAAAPQTNAQSSKEPTDPLVKKLLALNSHEYYALLDIQSTADSVALKKAYRARALSLHPDKNKSPGADEAFKRVGAAFKALSDPQQRMVHDASGGDRAAGAATPSRSSVPAHYARNRGGFGGGQFGDRDAEELFRAVFGDDPFGTATTPSANRAASHTSSGLGAFHPSALALRVEQALGIGQRLMRAFVNNPWTCACSV